MHEVGITINGIQLKVKEGTSVLNAAKLVEVKIPTLCKHKDLEPTSACGICVVKINGKMTRACSAYVQDGMEIITHDSEIVSVRRTVLELILSNHPNECLTCSRNQNCELQDLVADFGIKEEPFEKILKHYEIDDSNQTIVIEPNKCIKCERCIQACQKMQDVWALSLVDRGIKTRIAPAADFKLSDSPCINCGQCSTYCPVGAIYEYDDTRKVWDALNDKSKYCVVQIAPAVRVAIGESFGQESGEVMNKKLYTLFRRMGFRAVFDTNFGADITIMEEATELVKRLKTGAMELPLITSCCPAWVEFMEKFYHDIIPHFSTCKSPHQMLAVLSKTYYAQKFNINKENIFMVSVMPCIAKKYEIKRSKEMFSSGFQDIDVSITTRELSRIIKQTGIDFPSLPESEADSILGNYTGGGTLFGTTGGVMEAALRTVNYFVTGENLEHVELNDIRGLRGVKEAEFQIGDYKIKTAVAHGLGNVEYVLNKIREAKKTGSEMPYQFIEVMACPGGCIGGGGQPRNVSNVVRKLRSHGLYSDDRKSKYRNCHQNPQVKQLYDEFLGEVGGEKSHKLLHLSYTPRKQYEGSKID